MRQTTEQIELALDPSQNLLIGHKEFDVAQAPEVSNGKTAQVTEEAGVGNENGDEEIDDQGSGPSGNVVRTEGEVGVLFVRLDRFGSQEQEDPNAAD